MFLWNQWTAVKTSSEAEDLQAENKVIGGAPVWGRPRRLRCLCQSRCLRLQNAENSFLYFFSVLFIPAYGRRMAFYDFQSSTWPSRGRPISGHLESLWPFIWQVMAGSCVVLGDAARASSPGFSGDTYSR